MVWLYRHHLTTLWPCCFHFAEFPSLPSFNTSTVLHPHKTGGVFEEGSKGQGSPSHCVITTPYWGSVNSENQIRLPKSLSFLSTSSNISLSNWELNIIQNTTSLIHPSPHPPDTTSTTNSSQQAVYFYQCTQGRQLREYWKDRHSHHVLNFGPGMLG